MEDKIMKAKAVICMDSVLKTFDPKEPFDEKYIRGAMLMYNSLFSTSIQNIEDMEIEVKKMKEKLNICSNWKQN